MKAKVRVNRYYTIGEIDKRIYGSFVEHVGRVVYSGIYEPGHETADSLGFRNDVLELVKKLQVPIVRYPGGNMVSGYHWEDGTGDRSLRPKRIDCAWGCIEPNEVGIDEFQEWAKKANAEVMMAVNLGTRGPQDALNCLEYCNLNSDSYYANMRRKNGFDKPFGIKTWCLGNEMDGPWQIGHKTAQEYGRTATEAAKLMKLADPSIELVLCGSSFEYMPTFGDWELTVLDHAYDYVDYISLHHYYDSSGPLTADFLTSSMKLDRYIKEVVTLCDAVKAKKHSGKDIYLSVDEWNVSKPSVNPPDKNNPQWGVAPELGETPYTFGDALVVGSLLMTLQNNCDRVKMACLAQLVNLLAPIMTEKNGKTWLQTIFYPYYYASVCGRGTALKALVQSDSYSSDQVTEDVPYLATSVIHDAENKTVTVFALNRSLTDELTTEFTFEDFGNYTPVRHVVLYSEDVEVVNGPDREVVAPEELPVSGSASPRHQVTFRKHSWNMLQYRYDSDGDDV